MVNLPNQSLNKLQRTMKVKINSYNTKGNLQITVVQFSAANVKLIDGKTNEPFDSFLFSERKGKVITILQSK